MAYDSHTNFGAQNGELFSDEEITSYQVPHSSSKINHVLSTPASPPLGFLTSSLQSSLKGKSTRRCLSQNERFIKPECIAKYSSAPNIVQSSAFESLGMNDKDISWVSSMESLVAEGSPRLEFNTIERATFLPCTELNNRSQIQRRALFPSSSEDSLGFQPLNSSINSVDEPYSKGTRLSDVCDILNTLNVKNVNTEFSKDSNCYEFDIDNTLPGSPSLFSPKLNIDSMFKKNVEKQSSPSICQSPIVNENSISSSAGSFASTPHFKSKLTASPCIFSPIQERHCKLLPIFESSSLEESVLEVPLEETPKFKSNSQSARQKEGESNKFCEESKGSAAKCLRFSQEPNLIAQNTVNVQPSMVHKNNIPLLLSKICEDGNLNKFNRKQQKELYGSSANVTQFEANDIEEMFKILEENENASSQFFNNKVEVKNIMPNNNDFVCFNDFMLSQNNVPVEKIVSKRPAEINNLERGNPNFEENQFILPTKRQKLTPNNFCLEKSSWNSKNGDLINSQGEVTDTQIFQICEEVESKIAKNIETDRILPLRKGLGSRKRKKSMFSSISQKSALLKTIQNDNDVTVNDNSRKMFLALNEDSVKVKPLHSPKIENLKAEASGFCMDSKNVNNISTDLNENAPCESNGTYDKKYKSTVAVGPIEKSKVFNMKLTGSFEDHVNSKENYETSKSKMSFGFQTGNKNVIKLTESSIKRVENLFSDLDDIKPEEVKQGLELIEVSNTLKLTSPINEIKVKMLESCDSSKNICNVLNKAELNGSNSLVTPSESSLQKIRNIFKDCDSTDYVNVENNVAIDNKTLIESSETLRMGFKTGNEHFVKPSSFSLTKAKNIFENIDNVSVETKSNAISMVLSPFANPSTNSLANVKMDCEIMRKNDNLQSLSTTIKNQNSIIANKQLLGFQTGNNKIVKPLQAALAKVRNIFDNIDEEPEDNIKIAEPRTMNCTSSRSTDEPEGDIRFPGFYTGNKNIIIPSKAALAKVKNIFDNINDEPEITDQPETEIRFGGFRTGNQNIIKPSQAALEKVRNIFDNVNDENEISGKPENEIKFGGFCTGNKNLIKPSEAALAKVRNIFDNINDEPERTDQPETEIRFGGFRTGNKNIIKPSEAALAKVRNKFHNINDEPERTDQLETELRFGGFRTGNKNFIKPSKAALEKVRNIFDNVIDENEISSKPENEIKFGGFCTGNKNIIKPSKAALAKVRNIFDNIDEESKDNSWVEKPRCDLKLHGFSENKNVIKSSKAALKKIDCQMVQSDNYKDSISRSEFSEITTEKIENINIIHDVDGSCFGENNKENHKMSLLDESYSTLLENTDWDENIIPAWLHTSQSNNETAPNIFVQPALKRQATTDISLPWKKRKSDINEILIKRREARYQQLQMGSGRKGKVKPQSGSYILRKHSGKLLDWRHFLPNGPEQLQYDQLKLLGLEEYILNVTSDNAKEFRFKAEHYFRSSQHRSYSSASDMTAVMLQSQVTTLQWQLRQAEASRQMHRAVLEQVVGFLQRTHRSLDLIQCTIPEGGTLNRVPRSRSVHSVESSPSRLSMPRSESSASFHKARSVATIADPNCPKHGDAFREMAWRRQRRQEAGEELSHPSKLSEESFRLLRTVQSLLNTREPDLTSRLHSGGSSPIHGAADASSVSSSVSAPLDSDTTSSDNFQSQDTVIHVGVRPELQAAFGGNCSPIPGLPPAHLKDATMSLGRRRRRRTVDVYAGEGSPPQLSTSSADDESGFSSLNSFHEPIPTSLKTTHCQEVGVKHMRSQCDVIHEEKRGSYQEVGIPLRGEENCKIHRRWSTTPADNLKQKNGTMNNVIRVLWV